MSLYQGKNKSIRRKFDLYQTPYSMTRQLFENYNGFDFNKDVYEPAAGKLAIVKILQEYFNGIVSCSDINSPDGVIIGLDFIKHTFHEKVDYIITNPPFSLTVEFILKCMEVAIDKFALLMKSDFLSGIARYNLIYSKQNVSEFGLKYFKEFVRKPDLRAEIRKDGKYPTGIDAFAWYIWEKGYNKKPMISWINNQKYILKKGDLDE